MLNNDVVKSANIIAKPLYEDYVSADREARESALKLIQRGYFHVIILLEHCCLVSQKSKVIAIYSQLLSPHCGGAAPTEETIKGYDTPNNMDIIIATKRLNGNGRLTARATSKLQVIRIAGIKEIKPLQQMKY